MSEITDCLKLALRRFLHWLDTPVRPGMFYFVKRGEVQGVDGMADRSKIGVLLPEVVQPEGGDPVVKRRVTVTTEGESDQVFDDIAVTATEVEGVFPQNQDVIFSLVDTDNDGKESEPRTRTVQFTDETVPNQPGELNFEDRGEVQDTPTE